MSEDNDLDIYELMNESEVVDAINGLLKLRRYLQHRDKLAGFTAEIAGFKVSAK